MKQKYLVLFSLSGLILSLDRLTKHWVHTHWIEGVVRPIIPGLLSFTRAHNNGFAFGMLQRAPSTLQEIFFIAVPVFALVLIVLIFIKLQDEQMWTSIALTTIFAGAIGNLLDRFKYGYVVDFLKLHWQNRVELPAFNVADCSILVGVVIMFVNTLKQEPPRHTSVELKDHS